MAAEHYVPEKPTRYPVTRSGVEKDLFPRSNVRLTFRPSLVPCGSSSFSRASSPLRSFYAATSRPFHGLSCQGFFPHRDSTTRCPLGTREHAPALSSALRLSQPLDGLLHLAASGLIASRSHVQGCPLRGFSRSAAVLTRRQAMPPCRYSPDADRRPGCHEWHDRLRGFVPRTEAFR